MNTQLTFGLFCCAVMMVYFLLKGRKRDGLSVLATLGGCIVVLLICANWDSVMHLLPTAHAAQQTVVSSAPVHHVLTPHLAIHPQRTAAPTVATAHTRTTSTDSTGTLLSSFFLVLIIGVMLVVVRGRRRIVSAHAMPTLSGECPQCHQEGQLRNYHYQKGNERFRSRLCFDCAGQLHARFA